MSETQTEMPLKNTVSGPPLPDVKGRIVEAIRKEIKTYKPQSNWASKIGHPCKRYLVHHRLDWDKKPEITPEKKMLFDAGKIYERYIAKPYLEKAGFEIVEMGRPLETDKSGMMTKLQINGYLDFICRDPATGFEFPVEVKSISPYGFEEIDSVEDMLQNKKHWVKSYPAQLMSYLLGKQYEIGLFLLINKLTAEPKPIWVHQDYTYMEDVIKRLEGPDGVNTHVKNGTYPDRIPYNDDLCGKCEFADICLGDIARKEAEILDDPQLVEDLEEREMLKESFSRYNKLDKAVKKRIKGIEKGVAGDFFITGKNIDREGYTVEPSTYWKPSIKKLGGINQ